MKLARVLVLALSGAVVSSAYGCGGSSKSCGADCEDESGGSAGSGASGGAGNGSGGGATAGSGGASGSSGSKAAGGAGGDGGAGSPSAGESGEGGTGGTPSAGSGGAVAGAGNGGSSGAGAGGASSVLECQEAGECLIFSDCCSCVAVSGREQHASCESECVQSRCDALGLGQGDVTCLLGRCVFSRSCDASKVTCRTAVPECDEGHLPGVAGDCWDGSCVPAAECSNVTDCDACPDGTVCVEFQAQLRSFRCIEPPAGCEAGNYCECLPGACSNAPSECSEKGNQIGCACIVC